MSDNGFKGKIELDIRDSKPDWNVFLYKKAPQDAPNVLVILYDDTGCAAWSPYGGRINMPTMDRLAANGLTYTQWHTTAVQYPERVKELQGLWMAEAKKNNVFLLIDAGVDLIHELEFHATPPASGRYIFYPGTTEVPEATAPRTLGSSFKALAEVEFTGDSRGVIFAQGSRFGGYSLFVKDGKIFFVYNFLGIPPEQRLTTAAPTRGTHIIGVEFTKQSVSKKLECLGQMKLYLDDKVVAEAPFRTQSGHYALCGEGLSIGIDTGDSVSSEYKPTFEFTGGRILKVVFDVAKDTYVNVEKAMAASMARD